MDFRFGSDNNVWDIEDSARSGLEYDLAHGYYGSSKRSSGSGKSINRAAVIIVVILLISQGLAGVLTLLIIGAAALLIYGLICYFRHRRDSGKYY